MTIDEHMGLASEESSSYPDESGLELGLSLGGGGSGGGKKKLGFGSEWGQYARILTVEDLPSSSSLSSSSSSGPVSPPANNGPSNQVVGWPPIRAYRMNSMVNQVRYPSSEEFQPTVEKCQSKNNDMKMKSGEEGNNCSVEKDDGQVKKSNFVKVKRDGNGIGRKVDLSAHSCYKTLALTLEDMFSGAGSSLKDHNLMVDATESLKLLDGSSEFVLTYEDKDGDWMLVGDVPWGYNHGHISDFDPMNRNSGSVPDHTCNGSPRLIFQRMFINSVRRLRIMRTSEATGLGNKFQVRNL